jgi:hypothetical protein
VQRREAEEFLRGYLEAGRMPADKVKENDISGRTLRRATSNIAGHLREIRWPSWAARRSGAAASF